jgi:hypothetical protein
MLQDPPCWRSRGLPARWRGLDLRPFCVVARRFRGRRELSANRLEVVTRRRLSAVLGRFRFAALASCVVGLDSASDLTTQHANLQGLLRERRDSNPRPPA